MCCNSSTTIKLIKDTARDTIGVIKMKKHNDKPYITTEILEYIEYVRYFKKKYRSIWRSMRNLKRIYNNIAENNGKPLPHQRIIEKIGTKQYSIWMDLKRYEKHKNAIIRRSKRKYMNQVMKDTLRKNRNKQWYQVVQQIDEVYNINQIKYKE